MLDGTRLRQLRREHGLSQEQLADRAGNQPDHRGQAGTPDPEASCRGRTLARLAAALDEQPARYQPALTRRRNSATVATMSACGRPADGQHPQATSR